MRISIVIGPILAALLGCQGLIGEPGERIGDDPPSVLPPDQRPQDAPETFACDPTRAPEAPTLRRLSRDQLEASVRDIIGELAPSAMGSVDSVLDATRDRIPADLATDAADYRRMSQDVGQAHVDGYYEVARRVGLALTDDPGRLADAAGDCATDGDPGNDEACVSDFLSRFGRLVFRRPLTAAEIDHYQPAIDTAAPILADRFRHMITALLMSPNFVYLLELGADEIEPGVYALTAHELATRMSFHFWQSTPDEALLMAAESGELLTDAGYQAQVERMYADSRTQETLRTFYEDWLGLHELPEMDAAVGRADFQAYAGDDLPGPELRDNLIDDVLNLTEYVTTSGGTVGELFTNQMAFATTDDVAALYGGIPLWTPGTEPAALPAGQRTGLLSRPALLANNQATTRPILRGALIRKRILCDELSLPDNMMNVQLPEASGESTRERVEALTEVEGSVCSACHTLMNPLGFAFENYDALGRLRDTEYLYDESGSVAGEFPIDTTGEVVIASGNSAEIADGVQLSALIAEAPKTEACFTRHYFRFTFGRREDLSRDGCTLEAMRSVLADGGSIEDLFLAVATQPEFRYVRKEAL